MNWSTDILFPLVYLSLVVSGLVSKIKLMKKVKIKYLKRYKYFESIVSKAVNIT